MEKTSRRSLQDALLSEQEQDFLNAGREPPEGSKHLPSAPDSQPWGAADEADAVESKTRWEKLSVRIEEGVAARLRELALARRHRRVEPYTLQAILGEAVEEWIERHEASAEGK